jgi:hypothetical protein
MAEAFALRMGNKSPTSLGRPKDRLTKFLQANFRGPTELANEMGFTIKSAENLLNGHWPADDLKLAAIFARFGRDLYDAVFAPDVDAVLIRLQEEERQLAEQLAEIKRRRREAESLRGEVGAGSRAAPADLDRKAQRMSGRN